MFIIGHLRRERTGKVFPIGRESGSATENYIKPINDSKKTRELFKYDSSNRFYDISGISPCLNTMEGGGLEPKVAILRPKRTEYGKAIRKDYEAGKVDESRHNMTKLEPVFDGVSNTITTVQKDNLLLDNQQCMRIRKLTPKECWRLQGFPDWAFDRAKEAGVSDSQLYKQAGNSVTVNVIYEIAKGLK